MTSIYFIYDFTGKNDGNSSYSNFMGPSDKTSPYFVFVEQSDSISPGQATSVD